MPNHISNIVKITGEATRVAQVLETIKGIDPNHVIDFNTFSPMPTELIGTTSPVTAVSDAEYLKAVLDLDKKRADGTLHGYETLPITHKMQSDLIEKCGFDNWYDWSIANWGTKWNAYESNAIGDDTIIFQTAWSTPYDAMVTMSVVFDDVTIHVSYADEDFGSNVGEYTLVNGLVVSQNTPKSQSKEAIGLALDILGGEDCYLGDDFNDQDANQELDKYWNIMVELAYERGYHPSEDDEYPISFIERFKELAMADENYELMAELEKIKNN
jgi:hypothetical protein